MSLPSPLDRQLKSRREPRRPVFMQRCSELLVLKSVEMRAGNLGGECKDGASWLCVPGWRG